MALRQRRRPRRRAFPVSDTPTQSTDHRSRVGRPTRRIADAYSAVGGALLAAARSALHPRAALVAALGLDSVEKEAAARRTELVDQDGDAALLGANLIKQDQEITPLGSNNLVDPYQALPIGSILVDQDGEAALLGDNNLVKQDREMAPLGSNLVDPYHETAPPLGYIRVKAEGGKSCSEIVEEEEKDGTTAPIGSHLTGGIDRAFLARKGARIASTPSRNGPPETTGKNHPPTTSQRARKPHQPFWKKGGMCGDIFVGDDRMPRNSAKGQHIAADAGRLPNPTSSTARGTSRAAGVRHHLAAASSGSGTSLPPPPPPPPSGSPQGAQPAASGALRPVPHPNDVGSTTTSLPRSAAAVGAAVAAAVTNNSSPLQITIAATQAIPPRSPPPTPPPSPGSGGSGSAAQGPRLAAAGGSPPPVPPAGPAHPVVAAGPPAPNDRYFNWESNHINLAAQIVSTIFQVMGLGDALKAWTAGHLIHAGSGWSSRSRYDVIDNCCGS
ncbi:hypothetical protein BDA96_08G181000 [Sorghum bicolor]|uniref:Uncharacterized protein n=1 Tax=Sorghum bicolor TaxID=4558 RepID=A0A921QGW8_SORBI|nr:hypothetical protein BDA96_08G181000 [Sorghum bicolor]